MSEELKPCPFCGGKAVLGSAGGNSEVDGYRRAHTVTCKDCGIDKITFSKPYAGPPEAEAIVAVISAWNTRPEPSSTLIEEQAARIAILTAELEQIRGHREVAIQMANTASETATDLIARAEASQARLSEAVKVLERIAAHEPADGHQNLNDLIAAASVNAAKAFITTLGGEK